MRKNKLLLLLALLMTAATGAWATDYTTLAVGDVIKVGDTFTPTAESAGAFNDSEVRSGETYTLIRADVDNEYNVTEKTDGAYYVFKYDSEMYPYKHFQKAFAVTAISDGLEVTNIKTVKGMLVYILAVHESAGAPVTYTVSLNDGTENPTTWTASTDGTNFGALPIGGLKGDGSETVTLKYNGRLKVKSVTATSDAAPAANVVDLSTLTADYEAQNGDVLTGTLGANVKISIADGATVTLDGATINGTNNYDYKWAGITCEGDATIILSGTNTVKGFYDDYPGIQAAAGKTLIINGTGSLTASSYGRGAGIGGAKGIACGDIEIQGGTITATSGDGGAGIGGGNNASCGNIEIQGGTITATSGGDYGAGIGGGYNAGWGNITISGGTVIATGGWRGAGIGGGTRALSDGSCGNILISGGTVTATGGEYAAGIGGGRGYNSSIFSTCGTITITSGVTKVTATKGDGAPNSIGAGKYGTCGTVTIGGNEGAITTSPYTYQPSN